MGASILSHLITPSCHMTSADFFKHVNISLKTNCTVYCIVFITFSSSLSAQIYSVYIVNEVLISRSKKNSWKNIAWSHDITLSWNSVYYKMDVIS